MQVVATNAAYEARQALQRQWQRYFKDENAQMLKKAAVPNAATSAYTSVVGHLSNSIDALDKILTSFIPTETKEQHDQRVLDSVTRDYEKLVKFYENARKSGVIKDEDRIFGSLLKKKAKLFAFIDKNVTLESNNELLKQAKEVYDNAKTDHEKEIAHQLLLEVEKVPSKIQVVRKLSDLPKFNDDPESIDDILRQDEDVGSPFLKMLIETRPKKNVQANNRPDIHELDESAHDLEKIQFKELVRNLNNRDDDDHSLASNSAPAASASNQRSTRSKDDDRRREMIDRHRELQEISGKPFKALLESIDDVSQGLRDTETAFNSHARKEAIGNYDAIMNDMRREIADEKHMLREQEHANKPKPKTKPQRNDDDDEDEPQARPSSRQSVHGQAATPGKRTVAEKTPEGSPKEEKPKKGKNKNKRGGGPPRGITLG